MTATSRVLIIDDDERLNTLLTEYLGKFGYSVRAATRPSAGLRTLKSDPPDLVILDVMLPKVNGFEVVRTLRAEGSTVPIIMLSARGAEMDKVMGLELGAEDYITKPFSLAELFARVKAVLRRDRIARPSSEGIVQAGELEINSATRQVKRKGEHVVLTATEFEVLWCLVHAAGRVLTREQILARVWGPGHHGTPRTIDNFLAQLRSKLEVDPAEPRHLLTVRGVGYRFEA